MCLSWPMFYFGCVPCKVIFICDLVANHRTSSGLLFTSVSFRTEIVLRYQLIYQTEIFLSFKNKSKQTNIPPETFFQRTSVQTKLPKYF